MSQVGYTFADSERNVHRDYLRVSGAPLIERELRSHGPCLPVAVEIVWALDRRGLWEPLQLGVEAVHLDEHDNPVFEGGMTQFTFANRGEDGWERTTVGGGYPYATPEVMAGLLPRAAARDVHTPKGIPWAWLWGVVHDRSRELNR